MFPNSVVYFLPLKSNVYKPFFLASANASLNVLLVATGTGINSYLSSWTSVGFPNLLPAPPPPKSPLSKVPGVGISFLPKTFVLIELFFLELPIGGAKWKICFYSIE